MHTHVTPTTHTHTHTLPTPLTQALLPKLPKPSELKPYPSLLVVSYEGHTGAIHTLAPSPCGQWLGTGAADGCVKVSGVVGVCVCGMWGGGADGCVKV